MKSFLIKNNKITNDWNALNTISENSSSVGSLDLGIYQNVDGYNKVLKNLENNKFELVFLLGQDSLKFNKKNEFIIYQGSHGDNGAEIADIILPGAAYTEQDGYYSNLEGKLQKAFKASYPPGEAKEDWLIINELSENINQKKLFMNKEELESSMLNYLNLFNKNNEHKKNTIIDNTQFYLENIDSGNYDYYYSNSIARASKTMSNCRNDKIKFELTGTEG